MGVEDSLEQETKKWMDILEKEVIVPTDSDGEEAVVNIEAYIKDSRYFLDQGDLVRAFEAVIWAWALLTVYRDLGHIGYQ